jgi:hypothetical protein
MPGLLAHGFQSLIQTAPGAGFSRTWSRTRWSASSNNPAGSCNRCSPGDTVYPALEIDELTPNRTTGVVGFSTTVHNQRRECVLEGRQRYLLRRPLLPH